MNKKITKLDNLICFQFYKGWRELSRAYNNGLEKGVTLQYIFILLVLREHESLSVTKLCNLIKLDASAVSTIISRMEKKSLVTREHDVVDRRQVFIKITAQGKYILKNNTPVFEKYNEYLFGNLDDYERKVLQHIVKRLNQNRSIHSIL